MSTSRPPGGNLSAKRSPHNYTGEWLKIVDSHHDGLAAILAPTEGDHDPSGLRVALIEVVVEVEASVLALADLIVLVQDKGKIPGDRALINKR
jgi:hypothetical protein